MLQQQLLHTHVLPGAWETLTHVASLARLWPGTLFTNLLVVSSCRKRGGGPCAGCLVLYAVLRMRCMRLQSTGPAWGCLSTWQVPSPTPKPFPDPPFVSTPCVLASFPLQILIGGGTTFLFVRQAACAAANLTTNELLLRRKYGYLQDPFDEGPANNCVQVGLGRGRLGAVG